MELKPLRDQWDHLLRDSGAAAQWYAKRSGKGDPDVLCNFAVHLALPHFPSWLLDALCVDLCGRALDGCQANHLNAVERKGEAGQCLSRGDLTGSACLLTSAIAEVNELTQDGSLLAFAMYCNRAAVQYKGGNAAESLQDCQCALLCSPSHPKALYRRALARAATADLEGALRDADTLLQQGDLADHEAVLFRQYLSAQVGLPGSPHKSRVFLGAS
eukprot:jgi/Botrbrau1/18749/Bobra.0386s0072.1